MIRNFQSLVNLVEFRWVIYNIVNERFKKIDFNKKNAARAVTCAHYFYSPPPCSPLLYDGRFVFWSICLFIRLPVYYFHSSLIHVKFVNRNLNKVKRA